MSGGNSGNQANPVRHGNSLDFNILKNLAERRLSEVKTKLEALGEDREKMSVTKMFEFQLAMQELTQTTDMGTNLVAASNQAMTSVSRNLK